MGMHERPLRHKSPPVGTSDDIVPRAADLLCCTYNKLRLFLGDFRGPRSFKMLPGTYVCPLVVSKRIFAFPRRYGLKANEADGVEGAIVLLSMNRRVHGKSLL